jgi:DNA-binding beta-propeller fold protein YncE
LGHKEWPLLLKLHWRKREKLITYPVGITINPSTEKVYVANEFSNTVSVIDIPTLKVEKPTDQSKQENDKKSSIKGKKKIASIENLKEGQGIVLEENNRI